MKTILICVLFLVLSSMSMVSGRNCKRGLNYCGSALLKIGNYYDQLVAAAGESEDFDSQLFACLGGPRGEIKLIQSCTRCADGGPDHSDFCN